MMLKMRDLVNKYFDAKFNLDFGLISHFMNALDSIIIIFYIQNWFPDIYLGKCWVFKGYTIILQSSLSREQNYIKI